MTTSKGDLAKSYFEQGFNCSQSVAMAFCDDIDMDKEKVALLVGGFGGGIGRMREVCGCVCGMAFVLSALYGYNDPKDYKTKSELYSHISSIGDQFRQENGSVVCRELLGLDIKGADFPKPEKRTEEYYKKRPCSELVKYSATILQNYISQNPIE